MGRIVSSRLLRHLARELDRLAFRPIADFLGGAEPASRYVRQYRQPRMEYFFVLARKQIILFHLELHCHECYVLSSPKETRHLLSSISWLLEKLDTF